MSEAGLSLTPLFTARTSELVGRDQEIARLQKARDALKSKRCSTLLVYIAGPGGMGKTRFLEWLRDHPGGGELVTDIIDLYDTSIHSDVNLMEHIVDSALRRAPEHVALFEEFRNRMRLYRTQQSAGIGELRDIRAQIRDSFVTSWNGMTAIQPAIVLLDTTEVLQFQGDVVQRRLKLPLPAMYSKTWLTEMVTKEQLKRTLLVVAGRPEPKEMHKELLDLAGVPDRRIVLRGLDEDGVTAYIDSLAEALSQMQRSDEADGVRALNDKAHADLRRAFFHLTRGRPVALAILIQLYLSGQWDELSPLIEQAGESSSGLDDSVVRAALRRAMVNAVRRYAGFEDSAEVIQDLALLRKGMTAERLHQLRPGKSLDYCQSVIEHLKEQTFVKLRPDGSIVLHDEVADWFDEELYSDAGGLARARSVYRAILAHYDHELQKIDEILKGRAQQYDESDYQEPPSDDSTPTPGDEQIKADQEHAEARYQRRRFSLDALYYALRANAEQGYRRYYELAEEVFNGHISEMDAQIHSEFVAWRADPRFHPQAQQAGIDDGLVKADLSLRWVQRRFNEELGNKRGTVKLVDRLLKDQELTLDELARLRLRLYRATALGLSQPNAAEIEEVQNEFREAISRLRTLSRSRRQQSSLRAFLIEDALAFAFYERGFFEKNTGKFGEAIDSYAQSIWYYRDLSFEANQARSLNDRAYALAQVGELDEAEMQAADALYLRRRLGLGYLIALSLNTSGIIAALSGKTATAVDQCRTALQIMRRLNQPAAQVMVLRAYGEALRREAGRLPEKVERQRKFLAAAIERSKECIDLARGVLRSPSELLSEVLDEYACACRDMLWFCRQHSDPDRCGNDQISRYLKEAEDHFQRALQAVPAGDAFAHHVVDTRINLAYLHYYNGSANEARQWIEQAFEQIPESVRDPRQHTKSSPKRTVYMGYLSKAHSLLLRIAGDRLEELSRDKDHAAQRLARLDELLPEAILTIYFAERHGGNPHRVRMSRQAVYRQFKMLPSEELRHVYRNASPTSDKLGLPKAYRNHMRDYLRAQFGVSL